MKIKDVEHRVCLDVFEHRILIACVIWQGRSLSESNSLVDEKRRVMVFMTVDEVCKLLNIGHNTASKIFKDLDDYGLIERKKQGFARATSFIRNCLNQPKKTFRIPKKGKK